MFFDKSTIFIFLLGYICAKFKVFWKIYEITLEMPFMAHKMKLLAIFFFLTVIYCGIFIKLERLANEERETRPSGTTANSISATDQLKRRGSF